MKNGKKIFCLVFALFFVLSVAIATTGCGTGSTQQTTTAEATTAEATTAEATTAALPFVTIHWQMCTTLATVQKESALMEAELAPYLKEKINAELKMDWLDWGEYVDKTQVMISSGENMDILYQGPWTNFGQNVARGAFVDITEMIKQYMPITLKDYLNPMVVEGNYIKGKLYGVPIYIGEPRDNGIFFRKDYAATAGVDMSKITNMKELEAVFPIIKKAIPTVKFPWMSTISASDYVGTFIMNMDMIGDYDSVGKLLPDGSTKVVNQFELPEYKEWLLLLRDWTLKGYQNPNALSDKTDYFTPGLWFAHNASLSPYVDERVSTPTNPQGMVSFTVKKYISSITAQATNECISITSKNPERALMLMELANTDEFVNNTFSYGVEGKHYVKLGIEKGIQVIDFPAGLTAETSGFKQAAPGTSIVLKKSYVWKGQNLDYLPALEKFCLSAEKSAILGFNLDMEPIKTELAAFANVLAKYLPQLNGGLVDVETELPKLLAAIKEAGGDRIIAEKQKQIDEWLATQ